jgi:cytochrome c oxidase subunit II
MLAPASRQSHDIALLWWWMLGAAAIVFFGAAAMLGIAYLRRAEPGLPWIGQREDVTQGLVLVFGIAIPVVALVALFGVANVYLLGETSPPAPGTTAMTIDVIGHQWWWEVRYPGTGVVTANEIHLPLDTRVNVVATTADVIHSFWVPALNRKIDLVPGRRNRLLLEPARVGDYRGQCAQYCGFQHANMAFEVDVQRPGAYRAWLAAQERPPARARSTTVAAGQRVFMSSQCASCHTIAGTAALGTIGPDLTHLASRSRLASELIPNTPHELAAWIRDPQAIKPGSRMPDLGLSKPQIAELVAYLDSLR